MSDLLNRYYLQTMGIETWLVRQKQASCEKKLSLLAQEVDTCVRCPLHQTRSNTVFARGNPAANLMIVGEAPGFHEDRQGLPFVGKAGELLNKMLHSIGMSETDVYIANVLKCRPPENRDPRPEEIAQCSTFLTQQIELINPHLILALGRFAGQFLANQALPLSQLRKTVHSYQAIPVLVSYHPAYLLRQPRDKKKAYQDLMACKTFLTTQCGIPTKQRECD